jgi:multicomponent Na+:H+ antiporter subunit D
MNTVLMVVALLTMVIGILGAVAQADIKRLLSFTLISHIGYMILGVGLGTVAGLSAVIYYIVHHIVVQTTLFLATGLIERQGGTTSINRLGGLLKAAPVIAVLFFIPALNLGGIPPFSGFIGKLGLFEASAQVATPMAYVLIGAGALVSLLTLYALARVWNMAFWRSADEVKDYDSTLLTELTEAPNGAVMTDKRTVPRLMTAATAGMVLVSLALTVFAGPLYGVASRAGENLNGPDRYVEAVLPEEAR